MSLVSQRAGTPGRNRLDVPFRKKVQPVSALVLLRIPSVSSDTRSQVPSCCGLKRVWKRYYFSVRTRIVMFVPKLFAFSTDKEPHCGEGTDEKAKTITRVSEQHTIVPST